MVGGHEARPDVGVQVLPLRAQRLNEHAILEVLIGGENNGVAAEFRIDQGQGGVVGLGVFFLLDDLGGNFRAEEKIDELVGVFHVFRSLGDDHVVDVLLDSAAMGINTVEREGISYSHPARFSLVGTMNPEEGDIRPQLLDRFALSVKVVGEQDPEKRAEIIKRRLAYEADPQPFLDAWKDEQEKEVRRIERAMKLLPQVTVSNDILLLAAKISITLGVDGHRADITLIKTAETIAAVEGHTEVTKEDIREASRLALPHRMRRRPFEEQTLDWSEVDKVIDNEA